MLFTQQTNFLFQSCLFLSVCDYFICTVIKFQSHIVHWSALLLLFLHAPATQDRFGDPMPPLPLTAHLSPAAGTFTANLKRSVVAHPLSKSQQIAVLLPKIEAAMAQGSSRAHITAALLGVGIDVTQKYLTTVMVRLRRRRKDAVLPQTSADVGSKARVDAVPASPAPTWVARVPTPVFPTNAKPMSAGTASKYGAHDPRLLDEVMRSTPDMKALAKLAPKSTPQGNP